MARKPRSREELLVENQKLRAKLSKSVDASDTNELLCDKIDALKEELTMACAQVHKDQDRIQAMDKRLIEAEEENSILRGRLSDAERLGREAAREMRASTAALKAYVDLAATRMGTDE